MGSAYPLHFCKRSNSSDVISEMICKWRRNLSSCDSKAVERHLSCTSSSRASSHALWARSVGTGMHSPDGANVVTSSTIMTSWAGPALEDDPVSGGFVRFAGGVDKVDETVLGDEDGKKKLAISCMDWPPLQSLMCEAADLMTWYLLSAEVLRALNFHPGCRLVVRPVTSSLLKWTTCI